eukprot:scaffold4477_cov21-Tisochrysis_lutea.AAC.2
MQSLTPAGLQLVGVWPGRQSDRSSADDSWVVCGLGGKAPALALWSMDAGALAMRVPLPCVPQAMVVQPGEILLAGTAPALYKYAAGSACDVFPCAIRTGIFPLALLLFGQVMVTDCSKPWWCFCWLVKPCAV